MQTEQTLKKMPAQPTIHNGTIMIPIRYVVEALGAKIAWNGKKDSVFVSTKGQIPEEFYDNEEKDETVEALKQDNCTGPGAWRKRSGAVAWGIEEKTLNLQVAKILKEMLQKAGATVT